MSSCQIIQKPKDETDLIYDYSCQVSNDKTIRMLCTSALNPLTPKTEERSDRDPF